MIFDSTLSIPTTCGVPTLKSNITKKAAIAFDSCNNKLYQYNPKTLTWSEIAGGGGSTDTTSLSNRINLKLNISDTASMLSPYLRKVDTASLSNRINLKLNISDNANKWVNSINRISGKDSIIYFIGSTRYAIKDSVGTNPAPVGYYGAFQDTTTQTAASINTAYSVKLNRTDLSNGVSVVNDGSGNPTRITLANTGIYNIQFSLQLEKTGGSGNMIADIWIRKNGVDIPSTTGKVVLTGSANASPVIAAWNYVLDLTGGDYIQLMWATTNDNVVIKASPATSPHPSIPSVILTVTQQSGIMAGTGLTAINSLTKSVQRLVTGTSGTDFNISSADSIHTFNLPTASATNRGALSSTDWTAFNGKVNISDTATMLSPYLRKVDTASLSNRINTKQNTITLTTSGTSGLATFSSNTLNIPNYSNNDVLLTQAYQALGSTIKGFNMGTPSGAVSLTQAGTLVNQTVRYFAYYLPTAQTITGVKWFQNTIGNYTANNYNGVGLYTYSGGTLTQVASSTNDGTIWQTAASGSMGSKAFSSTYSAAAGVYYIALLYSASAQTTAPALAAPANNISGNLTNFDFTNSAKLFAQLASQTSLPSTQAASGLQTNTVGIGIWLY